MGSGMNIDNVSYNMTCKLQLLLEKKSFKYEIYRSQQSLEVTAWVRGGAVWYKLQLGFWTIT